MPSHRQRAFGCDVGVQRRLGAAVVAVCLALVAVPLAAQPFGRWWWDGRIGLGQRQADGMVDGRRVRRFAEQQAQLSLGLNGYVLHPAIGDFRVGVDLSLADYEGARLAGSDRIGAEILLNLLPQGRYPLNLYYLRNEYDNTPDQGEDPFSLLGIIDASDRWGGRLRLRKGPLRGLLLGFENGETEFLNPRADRELRDRQYIDWSRTGKKLNHHLRIERQYRNYGTVDLELEDHTANFDQHGSLTPSLRWELSAVVLLREIATGGAPVSSDDTRARSRLLKEIRQRDQLELRYDAGVFSTDLAATRDSQALSVFYRWRPREQWEIAPFTAYSLVTVDGLDLEAPRAGVAASWRRSRDKLTTGLGARVSLGSVERRQGTEARRDSQGSWALSASLRHGLANGFRQELEAEVSRNEIRFGRDPVLDLPDVILPPGGLTTEDQARVRGTLGWRWDSRALTVAGEWFRRDSARQPALEDVSADTLRLAIDAGAGPIALKLDVGETTARDGDLGEQELSYGTAVVSWRPRRLLRLQLFYRLDERRLVLAPDIDSERTEASLQWRLGAIVIEAQAFERAQRLLAGTETVNRGFRWSISRRLAGWLPIVTGANRRGVIR